MKALRALGALSLLLLPIHLPERMGEVEAARAVLFDPVRIVRGQVARNSTLGAQLAQALHPAGIHDLVEAARPVYDLARISAGRPFWLALGPNGLVGSFAYGIDELRTLRVRRVGGELAADILTRRYDVRTEAVSGVVRSSLFGAVADAGERDQLALDLADIFAWDVDFNTELQRGDTFRVGVEKLVLDGRFVKYGRIVAAELVRGERTLRAVRYEGASATGYYAPDGTPLRKAFLRSPLRFTRISSGFSSARKHPIENRVTAHRGIDFAAPRGTPVSASCDGVVTLAGPFAGYGNTVKLRHANGFETLYGHLSRIFVQSGQRVSQGTPIGAVGATGLATGPHLHYAMFRSGTYANPMTVALPPAERIAEREQAAFDAISAAALRILAQAPAAVAAGDARTSGASVRSAAPAAALAPPRRR